MLFSLTKDNFMVLGGSISLNTEEHAVVGMPLKITLHEHFHWYSRVNDIAIIHLGTPIRESSPQANFLVTPMKLSADRNPTGDGFSVAGFGLTAAQEASNEPIALDKDRYAHLHYTQLQVVDKAKCYKPRVGNIHDSQFCMEPVVPGSNLCEGDDGGGLYRNNSVTMTELVGLASYPVGTSCVRDGPYVFTNVAYFADWINATKWSM